MKTYFLLPTLAVLLSACSSNASTPPAEATAPTSTIAATTVGEQFAEAMFEKDATKLKALLADDVKLLENTPQERTSGKDSVAALFANVLKYTADFRATPLTMGGDANMVYYAGSYSQTILPSAKYKQGALDIGTYLLVGSKDSKNEWKITYLHIASAPLQVKK